MKIEIQDDLVIESMITFGARQRMVMTWWLLRNFRSVEVTPGFKDAQPDKNALSVEIFAQYMAQLEALEMVYFALKQKAANPVRSFTECFLNTHIKEYWGEDDPPADRLCGRRMLLELESMTAGRFEKELGLATYEALRAARCGKPIQERASKERHLEVLGQVKRWAYQAIENKEHRHMHEAYMKIKHGFGVLGSPYDADVYLMRSANTAGPSVSVVSVLPFNNSDAFMESLAEDTQMVGGVVIDLLRLYLGRSPADACASCHDGEKEACGMGETDG